MNVKISFKWLIIGVALFKFNANAQNITSKMQKQIIKTKMGNMAVFVNKTESNNVPVIFLHGVYFDHSLWNNQINAINDRTVFALDMPWHGESSENIANDWTLNDCSDMLLEILDSLKIPKVIAIGHSWGSMTILRAANKNPEKFASIGLCNMPFQEVSSGKKIAFRLQHAMLGFKNFYIKQAAKAMFGKESLAKNPDLATQLHASMSKLSAKQIKKIDKFVIIDAENTSGLISNLKIPAIALKGEHDYVPTPTIPTKIVEGGHVSPLEVPDEVLEFCKKVIVL